MIHRSARLALALVSMILPSCGGAESPDTREPSSPGGSYVDSPAPAGSVKRLIIQDRDGNFFSLESRDGSDPRKPVQGSDNLSDEASREAFLSTRVPIQTVVSNFNDYSQMLAVIFNVPIYCLGKVCDRRIGDPYPEFYFPTWRELFDVVARDTGSHWEYRADSGQGFTMKRKTETGFETLVDRRDGFVFSEPSMPLPYDIQVAEGWRVENRGGEIAYIPSIAPVGMDIYPWGNYSPEDPADLERMKAHIAGVFTRMLSPGTTVNDMEKRQIDGVEALFFTVPARGWRQWVFCKEGQCFAIVSSIDVENEGVLWPAVEKMVESFRVKEGS